MKHLAVASDCAAETARVTTADAGANPRVPAYTRAMQVMHWGTAVLLLCTYVAAWTIDDAPNPADKAWLIMLHRSLGLTVLLIAGIRIVIRLRTRVPPLPAGLPMALRVAARISAMSLYMSMISQPLLGLAASALHGDRVVLFGFVLPTVLPRNRALAHALFQAHGVAAACLLCLIALHAAAALYHHFIRKDHVLAGMLPGVSPIGGVP